MTDTANTGSAEVQWLVTDHLGTPRMIADLSGSLAGIKRHDYLPFGEELFAGTGGRTSGQGYAGDNVRQQFTGHERDTETGLDFMQARYYASTQGRFTGVDPKEISFETNCVKVLAYLSNPQNWNRYNYVLNNPLALTDPNGEEPNKAQAGTAQQVVAIIQKVERDNPGASKAEILQRVDGFFRTQPDAPGNVRYIYTKESGWIDAKHFFAAANDAANSITGEAGTTILGLGVEVLQTLGGDESAFSYEDLGSNSAGADFGADHLDTNGRPLSEQVGNYFNNTLGALAPQAANNYTNLPNGPAQNNGSRSNQTSNSRTSSVQSGRTDSRSTTKNTRSATDSDNSAGKTMQERQKRRRNSSQSQ